MTDLQEYYRILNLYFSSARNIDGTWVLNDTKYLEPLITAISPAFEAIQFLDMGAEAIIILVHDLKLDRKVIFRIPRPDMPDIAKQRFLRSAKVLANLKNGYFPRVLYLCSSPIFLVLDFTVGETMRDWCYSKDYSIDHAINYFREVLIGVNLLHGDDIVHRDLRPDNILIMPNGHVKIIDFGLSKTPENKKLTRINELGTRYYSPLEQLTHAGDIISPTADVFSLAQTFYFVITKQEGELQKGFHKSEIFLDFGLDPRVCGWYAKGIQIAPEMRFQNAGEMLVEYNKIFPVQTQLPLANSDICSLMESFFLIMRGDIWYMQLFAAPFLGKKELQVWVNRIAERRAKQCISL